MNEKDMNLHTASGIGVTTLFVVLIVLCLTVFSVLTFASSQADLRLSSKNAEMVEKYYEADNLGVQISAEVTGLWPKGAPRPGTSELARLERDIINNPGVVYAGVSDGGDNGFVISYSISVDTLLTLWVELLLPESGVCEVQSWQIVADEPEIIEDHGSGLWQGGGL
ncbi:MAG: hypothetical protein LBL49_00965 [Clostridiales Family XIII bacterium]|jgi:hypothetical protein|nr:hypothetical protein [Clostridiales Family XIII bacterium]